MILRLKFELDEFIDEILSHIPKEMWESTITTFCDLQMGGGQFIKKIIKKLQEYGHSDKNIKDRIYGYSENELYLTYVISDKKIIGNFDIYSEENINNMKFDVIIGNPPYQKPKKNNKKGKGGNNSLYILFIKKGIQLLKNRGIFSFVTPPAALIKSTNIQSPSKTLKIMNELGGFDFINLDAGDFFNVGTAICNWQWVKGDTKQIIKIICKGSEYFENVEEISYLPPVFTKDELTLFKKIVNNKNGKEIIVKRSDSGKIKDSDNYLWMCRFGYNYPSIGKTLPHQVLYTSADNYEFFTSAIGKWYLSFIKRHDAMTYHDLLTGIYNGKIILTTKETDIVNNVK